MTPDPKRTVQACRVYDALLRYYPIAFQREYGDTLALQFRDEYREVLASGKPLFRFWLFIVFDFIRSLLMEYQGKAVEMIKKHFPLYCGIAASVLTLILYTVTIFEMTDLYSKGWLVETILLPFPLIFGALILFSLTKAEFRNPVVRIDLSWNL